MIRVRHWLVFAASAVIGAFAQAPPRVGTRRAGVNELTQRLNSLGLQGRELADAAVIEVHRAYAYYSIWHLWESPQCSLASGRGWSHQYNLVLLEVLRGLGFEARPVHAARVRGWRHPWWHVGHAWVKVRIDGVWLDACASDAQPVGQVSFTPVSPVLSLRAVTRVAMCLWLVPFITYHVWAARLRGQDVPPSIYRERT